MGEFLDFKKQLVGPAVAATFGIDKGGGGGGNKSARRRKGLERTSAVRFTPDALGGGPLDLSQSQRT
jgi:hypothetical protein